MEMMERSPATATPLASVAAVAAAAAAAATSSRGSTTSTNRAGMASQAGVAPIQPGQYSEVSLVQLPDDVLCLIVEASRASIAFFVLTCRRVCETERRSRVTVFRETPVDAAFANRRTLEAALRQPNFRRLSAGASACGLVSPEGRRASGACFELAMRHGDADLVDAVASPTWRSVDHLCTHVFRNDRVDLMDSVGLCQGRRVSVRAWAAQSVAVALAKPPHDPTALRHRFLRAVLLPALMGASWRCLSAVFGEVQMRRAANRGSCWHVALARTDSPLPGMLVLASASAANAEWSLNVASRLISDARHACLSPTRVRVAAVAATRLRAAISASALEWTRSVSISAGYNTLAELVRASNAEHGDSPWPIRARRLTESTSFVARRCDVLRFLVAHADGWLPASPVCVELACAASAWRRLSSRRCPDGCYERPWLDEDVLVASEALRLSCAKLLGASPAFVAELHRNLLVLLDVSTVAALQLAWRLLPAPLALRGWLVEVLLRAAYLGLPIRRLLVVQRTPDETNALLQVLLGVDAGTAAAEAFAYGLSPTASSVAAAALRGSARFLHAALATNRSLATTDLAMATARAGRLRELAIIVRAGAMYPLPFYTDTRLRRLPPSFDASLACLVGGIPRL